MICSKRGRSMLATIHRNDERGLPPDLELRATSEQDRATLMALASGYEVAGAGMGGGASIDHVRIPLRALEPDRLSIEASRRLVQEAEQAAVVMENTESWLELMIEKVVDAAIATEFPVDGDTFVDPDIVERIQAKTRNFLQAEVAKLNR